jgi:hypothetical protein
MKRIPWLLVAAFAFAAWDAGAAIASERLRILIETDAGGDPDDEQSLVRFLLYVNEWDVEGIICTLPNARPGENLNPERTGLGIVRRQLKAYGECHPKLVKHDPRFPTLDELWKRTVPSYGGDEALKLILAAADSPDPRPIWICNWGTSHDGDESGFKQALDFVLKERGPEGYAKFKKRFRLSSADKFGDHTDRDPPWTLWVDTFRPELERKRWYHRFSALTATAGGFDLKRDLLTGHGPLAALYPTNTGLAQKEGDTPTFLYLVPTGMNDPDQPTWGSWAGRYGVQESAKGRPHYWANVKDTWEGTTHRDNTLKRWAVDLQNDFRARLDWCVAEVGKANHPPVPKVKGDLRRKVKSGERVMLDASESTDPDRDELRLKWFHYAEPGSYRGPPIEIENANTARASFIAPRVDAAADIHLVLTATDNGSPPLTRYRRIVVKVLQ